MKKIAKIWNSIQSRRSLVSLEQKGSYSSDVKPYSEIPGPRPAPLVGNTWRFIPFIGDFKIQEIDKLTLRLYKEYGPIVKISGLLGRPDMVFLYDADEIERVFRNEELMPFRPSMPSLNYYKHVLRKDFFQDFGGVIAVHGQDWYNFRTKVQQPMLQPRTAKLYIKTIEETASAFVGRTKKLRNGSLEVPEDYLNEIHKWSLESLAKIALDVRLGCFDEPPNPETQILIDSVVCFFENVPILELKMPFWKIFSTPTWKKYIKSLDTIKDIAMKHIDAAMRDLEKKNVKDISSDSSLLQRILAMDNNSKAASILALDMFLVGIDTTSTAVASILYQLCINPEVQEKLYEEVKTFLPDEESSLTSQSLEQMVYLKAVMKETLRKYPVVIGNGRCMTKDNVIAGYEIPKGVQIIFQHYAISNSEKYFEEANKFKPERWLKNSETSQANDLINELKSGSNCPASKKEKSRFHPFASLPFGYGRRMCLGRRFAELEIQTVIAKMVQNFRIEYHYGHLDYHINTMYTPNGPLKFRFVDLERLIIWPKQELILVLVQKYSACVKMRGLVAWYIHGMPGTADELVDLPLQCRMRSPGGNRRKALGEGFALTKRYRATEPSNRLRFNLESLLQSSEWTVAFKRIPTFSYRVKCRIILSRLTFFWADKEEIDEEWRLCQNEL